MTSRAASSTWPQPRRLIGLVGFIARNKFGAAVEWVGLISSAAYMGFVWNLFLGRLTALVSLRHSMILIMALSGVLLWFGALQTTAAGFSLVVVLFLLAHGLFSVQYNTLVGHLYAKEERPRLVSRRYLAVSAVSIAEVALFGWISKGPDGICPGVSARRFTDDRGAPGSFASYRP